MKPQYDHAISYVWVTDWNRAYRFYTDVLGFTKVFESDGWAEFRVPGLEDSFVALNRWARQEPHPKNQFLTLRVRDLMEFKGYLESRDVRIQGEVEEHLDEGQGLKMVKFHDSEGNVLTAAQILIQGRTQ